MSPPLFMLKLTPRMAQLASWTYARHLASRDGDLGYALHAALAAAFGRNAPKPFRLHEGAPGHAGSSALPALYGYGPADAMTLQQHAVLAEPDVYAALGLDTLAVKPMPAGWSAGRVLDFDVRVRPVVRCDRPGDRTRGRERDAFLAALPEEPRAGEGPPIDRESVYRRWLERELARDGAARTLPGSVRMTGFRRSRVYRRGQSRGADQARPVHAPEGPDALFTGSIQIVDGAAFAAVLRRGIGRHRAFGFGMLLLRPARGGAGRTQAC